MIHIKIESVSSDIRILRIFLIAFIALKPRSRTAVDSDMVNISRANDMTLANPSGVSAMGLVYVSNGQRLHFLDKISFSSGH